MRRFVGSRSAPEMIGGRTGVADRTIMRRLRRALRLVANGAPAVAGDDFVRGTDRAVRARARPEREARARA